MNAMPEQFRSVFSKCSLANEEVVYKWENENEEKMKPESDWNAVKYIVVLFHH